MTERATPEQWLQTFEAAVRARDFAAGRTLFADAFGAPEIVDLQLFLMWRGRGMALESPAVRP